MANFNLNPAVATLHIGLTYGANHPDPILRGSAMSPMKAMEVVSTAMAVAGFPEWRASVVSVFNYGDLQGQLDVSVLGFEDGPQRDNLIAAAQEIRKVLFQRAVGMTIADAKIISILTTEE